MLRAAITCDDPMAYLEHNNICGMQGEVDASLTVELGTATLRRTGNDVTLVSWSDTTNACIHAADTVAACGIDAEVIDLRCLRPWDKTAVLNSVRKTGRLIVAHESAAVGGFGAEVAATVAERAAGAKVSGRVGLVNAALGPGATNLVTGLIEALNAGPPIVAIIGDAHRDHAGQNFDPSPPATPPTPQSPRSRPPE